jgi:hypothetical protein
MPVLVQETRGDKREEGGKREKRKKENEFSSQRITPNLEFSLSVSSWS